MNKDSIKVFSRLLPIVFMILSFERNFSAYARAFVLYNIQVVFQRLFYSLC